MTARQKKQMYLCLALVLTVGVLASALCMAFRGARTKAVLADSGEYRVLVLGKDKAARLTDVIMLASFDLKTPSVSVLQIPRDTYLAYTNADYKKINGALASLGSERALCEFLEGALGVSIDSYVSFELDFLEDAVDMLGGVEVDVPFDMDYDDPYQNLSIHLKKGMQILSGKEAAHFVRYRAGYLRGDLGRIDAQKLFAASFIKSFLAKGMADDLPKVAFLAAKYLRTDMRVDTMVALASLLRSISLDKVNLLTLPGEEVQSSYSGAWYYIVSREGAVSALEGICATSPKSFDPKKLFTDVRRKSFREIYEKKIFPEVYTAQDLLGGKLKIENLQ